MTFRYAMLCMLHTAKLRGALVLSNDPIGMSFHWFTIHKWWWNSSLWCTFQKFLARCDKSVTAVTAKLHADAYCPIPSHGSQIQSVSTCPFHVKCRMTVPACTEVKGLWPGCLSGNTCWANQLDEALAAHAGRDAGQALNLILDAVWADWSQVQQACNKQKDSGCLASGVASNADTSRQPGLAAQLPACNTPRVKPLFIQNAFWRTDSSQSSCQPVSAALACMQHSGCGNSPQHNTARQDSLSIPLADIDVAASEWKLGNQSNGVRWHAKDWWFDLGYMMSSMWASWTMVIAAQLLPISININININELQSMWAPWHAKEADLAHWQILDTYFGLL